MYNGGHHPLPSNNERVFKNAYAFQFLEATLKPVKTVRQACEKDVNGVSEGTLWAWLHATGHPEVKRKLCNL